MLVIFLSASIRAIACGPDFPNWLLTQGDQGVLMAPVGNFAAELARMNLGRTVVRANPPETNQTQLTQSIEADLADLGRALKQAKIPAPEIKRICGEHELQRRRLVTFLEEQRSWKEFHDTDRPPFEVQITAGLPGEFADYFEGLIAWHNPAQTNKQAARAAWERLLALPEAERRYKSTWATFMLGKSWEKDEPGKAIAYFQRVRELRRQKFYDSLGLAAASLGFEARVQLREQNFGAAIDLYLEQMVSGDPTATNSLATAAGLALQSAPENLSGLARNPRAQKVITAYLISRCSSHYTYQSVHLSPDDLDPGADDSQQFVRSPASAWLEATEAAGIKDLDSAEALALAAYRANDMDAAQRWIRRCRNSPIAQWLQAKLWLRAGKLDNAAALLAKVSTQFPIIHEATNAPPPLERKDDLRVKADEYSFFATSAERQVHGELGVLRLARGEYIEALDSLLNAGFWMDAAYVAERVLTLEELRNYVDRFWPAAPPDQVAAERERFGSSDVSPAQLREQIRYLLARRLTRELRGDVAREYYPPTWVGAFDELAMELRAGWNESTPADESAGALLRAALITRTNGLELIGTEVAPDWRYHLGQFEVGVTGADRSSNNLAIVLPPLPEELRRDAEHCPEPDQRFHYRYQAAALAWEAARRLPDNDDRTAFILWQGGSFLKNRDPDSADLFYKALVRRNRRTVLGAEADRQRWFPKIDENGYILTKPSRRVEPTDSEKPEEQ